MGDRRCRIHAGGRHITLAAALLALGLPAACSSGPSQKELAVLEERQQAEEARLQRKLAEKKAEQKAAEEKKAATAENLAN